MERAGGFAASVDTGTPCDCAMMTGMRTRASSASAVALATATLGMLVVVACGGSEAQDVLATRSAPASTVPTSSGASGASGASGSSGGTSGSSGSSGSTGSSGADASVDCPQEVEPNDNEERANQLAPSRCGAITPNSESDFLTFVLSPTSTSMQIKFDGKVTLRVRVANESITLGGSTTPKVPFLKGETYVIEIKATVRDNRVPWRVDLIEK